MRHDTLCFLLRDNQVLLGMKKRGFGEGNWNGFGGKSLSGENIIEAAVRELHEESSVLTQPSSLEKIGALTFHFDDPLFESIHVSVFLVKDWSGEPVESEEMAPQWFSFDEVPYGDMWEDDKYWLPHVLAGKTIEGIFSFDNTGKMKEAFELQVF